MCVCVCVCVCMYEYCSDEELLAEELSHLLQVFVGNGYPANTVWRSLYQDNKGKKNEVELDVSKSLYAPYHTMCTVSK